MNDLPRNAMGKVVKNDIKKCLFKNSIITMKKFLQSFCFILFLIAHFQISAQKQNAEGTKLIKRYKNDLFTNIDSLIDIPYGEAINLKGENEKLLLNLFMPPAVDTVKNRPLVIFIHGGGFRNNNKSSSISNKLGIRLGKRALLLLLLTIVWVLPQPIQIKIIMKQCIERNRMHVRQFDFSEKCIKIRGR